MKNYLEILSGECKISNHDYTKCWIVVNNSTRVKQIQDSIRREMINKKYDVILPPLVLSYPLAFLYLSAEICLQIYNKEKITEYSEEWIELLWFKIALQRINLNLKDEYGETRNLARNLGKDLKNFVRDVTYYCYDIDVNALNPNPDDDILVHDFINSLKQYVSDEENLNPLQNHTFLTPLHAYKFLYKFLMDSKDINKDKLNLPELILIEDYDDLEPIFQKIISILEAKNLVKIKKIQKFENQKTTNQIEIIPFINSLDEAEGIAYKVIELLENNTPAEDIGIVFCNKEIEDLLILTFHRFGILLDRQTQLKLSEPFRAVFSTLKIISKINNNHYVRITEDDIQNILNNRTSKFFVKTKDDDLHSKILSEFIIKGKRLNNETKKVFEEIKEKFKHIPEIDEFFNLIISSHEKENLIMTIVEKVINYDELTGTNLRTQFFSAMENCDKILNELKDKENFYELCIDVLSIVGKREYVETNIKKGHNTEHFIPMISADKADNITAKTLFICGLDANFEKNFYPIIPESIVTWLNSKTDNKLPTFQDRMKKIYEKLNNAIKNAEKIYLTYSHYDLINKEKGFSIFLYQFKNKEFQYKKGYELIPQPDVTIYQESNAVEIIKINDILIGLTVEDLFKEYQKKRYKSYSPNEYTLKAKEDLTTFIFCPRQFLFNMLSEVTDVKSPIERSTAMLRGEFWHKVFSESAKDPRFNLEDPNEIFNCLKEKFHEVKKEYNIHEFENYPDDNFIESTILRRFAENEAKRKSGKNEKNRKYHTLESEFQISIKIQNFTISAQIDRIDSILDEKDKYAIIEYKIYGKGKELKFLEKPSNSNKNDCKKGFLVLNKDSIQLSIYSYIYVKNKTINTDIECGVINLFGEGKIDELKYGKEISKDEIFELIEKSIYKFNEFLSKKIDINDSDSALFFYNEVTRRNYDEIGEKYNCNKCMYKLICSALLSNFKTYTNK
jgi:hypothetical protein